MASASKGLYGSDTGSNMVRASVAELIGTFLLVLAGISVAVAAVLNQPIAGMAANSLAVALSFGFVLVALVTALGHVSGAHFNPAVTLGLASTGKFPWKYVPAYIGAQIAGACVAASSVLLVYGSAAQRKAFLGATYPVAGASLLQVFIIEAVITFLLMFVIVSVATDDRVPAASVGPAVGFALTAAVLIGGPISGGAVNPARALGPMIVAGKFTAWWVYIIGPVIGAIVAAVLYDRFLAKGDAPDSSDA